jgi:hypothetical protein
MYFLVTTEVWLWARRVIAIAMVVALLLPVLGPAVDHHFADRLPAHEHVYAGGGPAEHTHDQNAPHSHDPGDEDGVVTLVHDHAGFSSGAVISAMHPAHVSASHAPDSAVDLWRLAAGDSLKAPQAAISPLSAPPRA